MRNRIKEHRKPLGLSQHRLGKKNWDIKNKHKSNRDGKDCTEFKNGK